LLENLPSRSMSFVRSNFSARNLPVSWISRPPSIYTGQSAHTSPTEAAGGIVAGVFHEGSLPPRLQATTADLSFILMLFCSESLRAPHCCPQHSRVKHLSARHSGPSSLLPQVIPAPFPSLKTKTLWGAWVAQSLSVCLQLRS